MNKLYSLYTHSFPDYPVSEETFTEITAGAHVITRHDGDTLTGFAVVRDNSISILCVHEDYRRRGIGSSLLEEAESHIKQNGGTKITLGQGSRYIFQGVPEENPGTVDFFKHHGYTADWSSVNMRLDLREFDPAKLTIHQCPTDVSFRYAEDGDTDELLKAVSEVNKNWVKYFLRGSDPVLLAVRGGRIIGFEFVSAKDVRFEFAGEKSGSVGCVGVVPSARRHGIGLQMVAQGLARLKEDGCTSSELLYVALVDWYSQLGFKTMHTQWMGRKEI